MLEKRFLNYKTSVDVKKTGAYHVLSGQKKKKKTSLGS
jgi:hypothetical protein